MCPPHGIEMSFIPSKAFQVRVFNAYLTDIVFYKNFFSFANAFHKKINILTDYG